MALKPKWLVGIIIGALMIYLSIFGLSGLLYALVNPVFSDHFTTDTKSSWGMTDVYPVWETASPGDVLMAAPSQTNLDCGIWKEIVSMDSASVSTCEISVMWIGTAAGRFRWLNVLGTRIFAFMWMNGQLQSYVVGSSGNMQTIATWTPTANVWYKFTMQLDKALGTMKLYRDNVAFTTLGGYYDSPISYNCLVGQAVSGSVKVDYVECTVDKQEPSGGGNPTTGTLKVYTYRTNATGDRVYPFASFSVSGPSSFSATWQSDGSGFVQKDNLESGVYSFTASGMTSNSGSVTAGLSTTVTLRWPDSGPGPGPTDWWAQIVAAIQQILSNAITVNALRWIGVLVTVASTLMFINVGSLMKTGKSYPDYRTHR